MCFSDTRHVFHRGVLCVTTEISTDAAPTRTRDDAAPRLRDRARAGRMRANARPGVATARRGAATRTRATTPKTSTAPKGPTKESENATAGAVARVPPSRVRNFSIIAHIDHGKSTLADTLLSKTNTVKARDMKAQVLDSMELERERGITIKLNSARMDYVARDGELYVLNLIDTPGHVDFTYEVSRSLAACEGALLVVDSSQGVEAQTVANVYLALENDLEIFTVLNKIDLPGSEPDRVKQEIEDVLGLDASDAILASAKANIGMDEILERIVEIVPPPRDTPDEPFRALVFDSYFDSYRGVVAVFRVMDGTVKTGDAMKMMATGAQFFADEIGVMRPDKVPVQELGPGEVGYIIGGIKSVADARVGDTITTQKNAAKEALPGYSRATPMVFAGIFPVDTDRYDDLRESLGRLQINDASLSFEPEQSSAMGTGFRCGFLGLLHMEIIQERLEREYDLDLITTSPSVVYHVYRTDGTMESISNPAELAEPELRDRIEEPYCRLDMIAPSDYVGTLMELATQRRGEFIDMTYLSQSRTSIKFDIPLAEVVTNYFDEMKSRSRGYASMEYSMTGYRESDLVRLDVLINQEPADPLAVITHRSKAYSIGRQLVDQLKLLIPRQMFRIPIQAAIGNKVIASSSISAMRKDVLAKCYGGDISRKKKLLKKQAAGKKRMKQFGKVEVPQEAFLAVLKVDPNKGGGE